MRSPFSVAFVSHYYVLLLSMLGPTWSTTAHSPRLGAVYISYDDMCHLCP